MTMVSSPFIFATTITRYILLVGIILLLLSCSSTVECLSAVAGNCARPSSVSIATDVGHKRSLSGRRSSPSPSPSSRAFLSSQPQRTGLFMTDMSDTDTDDDSESSVNKDPTPLVQVGTKEYLDGFLLSPIRRDDNTASGVSSESSDRGDGIEQAIKLAGGVSLFLVVLVVGFMASNGLL